MKRLTVLCAFVLSVASAPAAGQSIKIYFSSGTGFFVSPDGYALSNSHVVRDCQRLVLTGAGGVREAGIVARDEDHDLILLKTDGVIGDYAHFREGSQPIQTQDRVVIVGYPGDSFKTGATVTREAVVLSATGPKGEEKWMQLSDVVTEGNSGGPLLDDSGNVVGIVSAKAVIYTYREDAPHAGTTQHSGIAVNLPIVRGFLDRNGVRYREAYSGGYLSADRVTDQAHRFVVNVRCETKTERQ